MENANTSMTDNNMDFDASQLASVSSISNINKIITLIV